MKKLFLFILLVWIKQVNAQVCFESAANFSTGSYPNSLISADFNGDGFVDLATANNMANNVSVLLGNGAGGFNVGVPPTVTI